MTGLVRKYAIGVRGKEVVLSPHYIHGIYYAGTSTESYSRRMPCTFLTSDVFHTLSSIPAESNEGYPLSLPSSHIRAVPDVKFDGAGHIIFQWKKQMCKIKLQKKP